MSQTFAIAVVTERKIIKLTKNKKIKKKKDFKIRREGILQTTIENACAHLRRTVRFIFLQVILSM